MKDKRPVEEIVAEMSEKEKNKIVRIGTIYISVVLSVIGILVLIIFLSLSRVSDGTTEIGWNQAWLTINCCFVAIIVFYIASIVFMKIGFPDYSDKLRGQILKMREEEEYKKYQKDE